MTVDLYIIGSQGRTATTWITAALNLHPEIAAAHGPRLPLAFRHTGEDLLAPAEPSQSSWGQGGERFRNATLRDIIADGRREIHDERLTLVHAINVYELRSRIVREQFLGQVRAANVVRHPVTHTQSYASHFLLRWNKDQPLERQISAAAAASPVFQKLRAPAAQLGFDLNDPQDETWLIALSWIANDFNDLDMDVLHVPYERLVSDPDYFCWFLQALYGIDLPLRAPFIEAIRGIGAVNETSARKSAVEVFAQWDAKRRALFRIFAAEHHLRQRYAQFQYELGFVFEGDTFFV